ncbi:Uncharacterised protein [Amycolatopsis camponoti]|uniref:Uncharacterized protein n=1 Tax=Amycolatopsis camponoti TaxID=2606593 RepID=A0A6I8M2T0_9PSEU|nr:Uncharacterised protein [Amycolatopsis camponoti]
MLVSLGARIPALMFSSAQPGFRLRGARLSPAAGLPAE